ncbi:glycosyltransferase [candidate division KSB1 bacterium]|nr:glycosyltransferase [candidate division KSB1 bacterium]
MNILFVSPENPWPPDHGHHIRTYNVIKWLAKNHTLHLVAFAKHPNPQAEQEMRAFCHTVETLVLPEGKWRWRFFAGLFINLFSPLPFTVQKFVSSTARLRLQALIRLYAIDIVHVDMLHLATYRPCFDDLPTVLVHHNIESLLMQRKMRLYTNPLIRFYLYLQYRKLSRFESRVCSAFDLCTAVSDYDREGLQQKSPRASIRVIPNGVDSDYFRSQNPPEAKRLAWVGGMRDYENASAVDYFLRQIWPKIEAAVPETRAVFVGRRPTALLQSLAQKNSRITCTDYVADVRPFMEKAAIFIAPLKSGGGTKVKVLNAMSMARAVVTTSIGAEGILAMPGKEIVIADHPEDFAEQVIRLLQNPQQAKAIGKAARQRIQETYDWSIVAAEMERLYGALVEKIKNHQSYCRAEIPNCRRP